MEHLSFDQSSVSEHYFTLQGFFAYFYDYVDIKVSQSRFNEVLLNSLQVAHKLTHLDLRGQPIRTLNCLPNQKSEAVGLEVLILNDCLCIDENSFSESQMRQMSKINILSMNRTKLCSNEAVKLAVSLPALFSLFVKGIPLPLMDVIFIVDRCKNPQLLEMSHSINERDNEVFWCQNVMFLVDILEEFLKDAVSCFIIP